MKLETFQELIKTSQLPTLLISGQSVRFERESKGSDGLPESFSACGLWGGETSSLVVILMGLRHATTQGSMMADIIETS